MGNLKKFQFACANATKNTLKTCRFKRVFCLNCVSHMKKIFLAFRRWELNSCKCFAVCSHYNSTSASTSSPPMKTSLIFSLDSTITHCRIFRMISLSKVSGWFSMPSRMVKICSNRDLAFLRCCSVVLYSASLLSSVLFSVIKASMRGLVSRLNSISFFR